MLGFGRIGRQVARRALALEMKVVAYDPFVSAERFRELGVEPATFGEVLERAEFLTLHLPLTDDTRNAIDADTIAHMRDGVRIVNAARGELVDEAALVAALESGKVAGAAIDVFSTEPYAGPLLQAPNVVVTPHLAASTEEAQDRAGVVVAEQVVAALDGGLVTNAVNIPQSAPRTSRSSGRSCRSRRSSAGWRWSSPAARRDGSASRSTASSPSTTRGS